jgi:hypothetical protein
LPSSSSTWCTRWPNFFFGRGGGQQRLVPLLLLLSPPFFPIILFMPATLLTGMTGRVTRWVCKKVVQNEAQQVFCEN